MCLPHISAAFARCFAKTAAIIRVASSRQGGWTQHHQKDLSFDSRTNLLEAMVLQVDQRRLNVWASGSDIDRPELGQGCKTLMLGSEI